MSNTFPTGGRRCFLAGALAMAAGSAAAREAGPGGFVVEDQRPFKDQTRRLKITREGRPVAALLFPTDYPTHFRLKPELHNVITPSGVLVTGAHEHAFIHRGFLNRQASYFKDDLIGVDVRRSLPG